MGRAIDELASINSRDEVDDLAKLQLQAAHEQLVSQRGSMRALDYRATDAGIGSIKSVEDLVPLLFAHSTYKTYPESFIEKGKWSLLSTWLDTVSTCKVSKVDVTDVVDLDDWIDRLSQAGITIIASSGTTGKHSFITLNEPDFERLRAAQSRMWEIAPGVGHPDSRPFTYLGPMSAPPLLEARRKILPPCAEALSNERVRLAENVAFARVRNAMANGTATPSDVKHMEIRIKERSDGLLSELKVIADRIFSYRSEPQTIMGMVGMFWRLMEVGKEEGIPEGSFHPETLVLMNGGLKGLRLPDDYQEQLSRFFGRVSSPKMYGMTELSSQMPMCAARMYHVPVELLPLILDETGEHLMIPGADGKVTGRFAAFNLLVEGHWGGVISGDLVTANFSPFCECGLPGPVIEEHVQRYSELSVAGDDKLTCGGTMEQYIRGSIEPELA